MANNETFARPTAKDYKDTRRLLSDFCIPIKDKEIPEFRYIYELIKWRTQIITTYLDGLAV